MHNLNTNCKGNKLFIFLLVGLFIIGHQPPTTAQCNPDQIAPIIACDDNLRVSIGGNGHAIINLDELISDISDNCDAPDDLSLSFQFGNDPISTDSVIVFDCDDIGGPILLQYFSTDQSNNIGTCITEVVIEDKLAPYLFCLSSFDINLPPDGNYLLDPISVIDTVYDNCNSFSDLVYTYQLGDAAIQDRLLFDCSFVGSYDLLIWGTESTGARGSCELTINILSGDANCDTVNLSGNVYVDENDNCLLDGSELGLENWLVEITNLQSGFSTIVTSDEDGSFSSQQYTNESLSQTDFSLSLLEATAAAQTCINPTTISVLQGSNNANIDIPATLTSDCPLLTVDLATDRLRFCDTAIYQVNYCNLGITTVSNVFTNVYLDPYLSLIDSDLPWIQDSNGSYNFFLGDLDPATCGSFSITVQVACTMPVGQTLCSEASIAPSVICEDLDPNWTGASIEVTANCDGDNVIFQIQNTGTGVTEEPLEFRIIEDVVMYMQDTFQLHPAEFKEVMVPANGATWRIEADQAPGHPGVFQPAAWIETCGGFNQPGLVNIFPTNNTDPFESVHCLEVVYSFDPNDKQGFPRGIGENKLIALDQAIEYMIRFQNTGTDTAFQVTIIDTLDQNLVAQSIQPGASSHPYRFETDGQGIIKFIFDPIALPDSTINERASRGFVKFRIQQQPGLSPGTQISNQAAIYFDLNDPIITNTILHTIQDNAVLTDIQEVAASFLAVYCHPNPAQDWVSFELAEPPTQPYLLRLFSSTGQIVRQSNFDTQQLGVNLKGLATGIYFYSISDGLENLAEGKLIID